MSRFTQALIKARLHADAREEIWLHKTSGSPYLSEETIAARRVLNEKSQRLNWCESAICSLIRCWRHISFSYRWNSAYKLAKRRGSLQAMAQCD